MSWEIGLGLVTLASVFGLLKIVTSLNSDQEGVKGNIMQGVKIYLSIIALFVLLGSVLSIPDVINASIDSTDTNSIDNVKDRYITLYKAQMFTLIPFLLFMLVMLIIDLLQLVKDPIKGGA